MRRIIRLAIALLAVLLLIPAGVALAAEDGNGPGDEAILQQDQVRDREQVEGPDRDRPTNRHNPQPRHRPLR